MLKQFSMSDANPVNVPLPAHMKLSASQSPITDEEITYMNKVPYAEAIGSLMYLMTGSRPDISFCISLLSRYMSNPGPAHWEAVKWLFRYIKGTNHLSLCYRKTDDSIKVEGYVDASYASDYDNRKSTSAYYIFVAGNCVSWKSQLQPIVSLSSTEAEFIAATEAIKELIWVRGLLSEIKISDESAVLKIDSQSAIYLCKDPMLHERSKHIDVRYYFIRDIIANGQVCIQKVKGNLNIADFGTKIVPFNKFCFCRKGLQVED